jgi:hypothetical protein
LFVLGHNGKRWRRCGGSSEDERKKRMLVGEVGAKNDTRAGVCIDVDMRGGTGVYQPPIDEVRQSTEVVSDYATLDDKWCRITVG